MLPENPIEPGVRGLRRDKVTGDSARGVDRSIVGELLVNDSSRLRAT